MNGKTNASDITINQVVNGVLIPLEPATDFQIGSGSGRAYFTWTDPVDKYTNPGDELVSQWGKSVVVRKKDSAPSNIDDGIIVLTETVRNQYQTNQYIDEAVDDDTTYYYSVYPVTTTDLVSDSTGGVVVIPMGGEPSFTEFITNPFNIPAVGENEAGYRKEVSVASTDTASFYVGGMEYGNDGNEDVSNRVNAYTTDLTMQQLNNLPEQLRMFSVGELPGIALFRSGYDNSYRNPEFSENTYCFDNSMTRSTIKISDAIVHSRCVSSENYAIFAGGSNNSGGTMQSWTNEVDAVDTDLTYTKLTNLNQYAGYLAGSYTGIYHIYGLGDTYDRYPGESSRTMFCYDDNLTKVDIPNSTMPYTNDIGNYGVGSAIGQYALFTRDADYHDGDVGYYTDAYASDLTRIDYTNLTKIVPSMIGSSDTHMGAILAIDTNCITYNQYSNYAHIFSAYDISVMAGPARTKFLRFNDDLTFSYKDLTEYITNLEAMTSSNFRVDQVSILNQYMLLYSSIIALDHDYMTNGTLLVLQI